MQRTTRRQGVKLDKQKYQALGVKAGVLAGATYPEATITPADGSKPYPDPRAGMAVALIAAALHFGTAHNPKARPFLTQTVTERKVDWSKGVSTLLRQGVPLHEALSLAGDQMRGDIQNTIQRWPPDNSEEWADVKGFNHGLVFTSHLVNSIQFEVFDAKEQK